MGDESPPVRARISRGFLVFRVRWVPVRVHWTAPLGLFVFGGLAVSPALWLVLIVTVIVHELGHAALVKRFGLTIESIDLHGLGGACRWVGPATPLEAAAVAWGGLLSQAVVVAVLIAARGLLPAGVATVTDLAIAANLYMIGLNLLPLAPFDGARAWAILHRTNLEKILRPGRRARRRP